MIRTVLMTYWTEFIDLWSISSSNFWSQIFLWLLKPEKTLLTRVVIFQEMYFKNLLGYANCKILQMYEPFRGFLAFCNILFSSFNVPNIAYLDLFIYIQLIYRNVFCFVRVLKDYIFTSGLQCIAWLCNVSFELQVTSLKFVVWIW